MYIPYKPPDPLFAGSYIIEGGICLVMPQTAVLSTIALSLEGNSYH